MVLNNISGQAERIADTLGVDPESGSNEAPAFNRDYTAGSFDSFGGSVDSDQFYEIARFQVPASTEYAWGYGRAANPENQGYLYVDLQDSSDPVEGTLRLMQESATGRQTLVVADFDTTTLDGSKTDRTQRVPLPEQVNNPKVGKDSYLVVELETNSDTGSTTVNTSNSDVVFPVTEYDLSQM
jgi:hypothetical protein